MLIDTVECYFDSGMNVRVTAKRMVLHPDTVRNRVGRFCELTGGDLHQPSLVFQAWWAIQHHRAVSMDSIGHE